MYIAAALVPFSKDKGRRVKRTTMTEATADKNEILTDLSSISTDASFAARMEQGKWEVVSPGLMIFYESDNSTEIARFELYDSNDMQTTDPTRIVKRVRV